MLDTYLTNFELYLLVFIRSSALMAAMPVFDDRSIPIKMKLAFALILSLILSPLLPQQALGGEQWLVFVGYALREGLVGLVLGFSAKLLFWGVEYAGQVIAYQMGFALANVLDPESQQQIPLISRFKYLVALTFLLAMDGHHLFLAAFKRSFDLVPVGGARVTPRLADHLIAMSSGVFMIGVKIAAPVMLALFLTNVAMALVARTVPQMNIFIIAFPVGIAVGFFMLIIGIPAFLQAFGKYVGQLQRDLILIIGALQGG